MVVELNELENHVRENSTEEEESRANLIANNEESETTNELISNTGTNTTNEENINEENVNEENANEITKLNGNNNCEVEIKKKKQSKIRCCCIKRVKCCTGALGVVGILCVLGGLLLLLSFRHIVEFFIGKFLVLEPNNELFVMWKEPPLPVHMSVYLFNITNKEEFPWHNTKPNVQQIGPYVFREVWNRTNVQFHPNGTLTYTKVKSYYFNQEMTVGSLDDVVTSLNVPAITVGKLFKTAGPLVKMMLSSMLHFLHEQLFVQKQVRQLLFEGYEDPLIKVAAEILGTYPFDRFGYFYGKNGTGIEEYSIYTGANGNSENFTVIEKYRNKTYMEVWDGDECNQIRGTDGSSYPPFLDPSKPLELFAADMCKVMKLVYKEKAEYHGLSAFSYELSDENFDNGTLYPKNKCYCSGGHCLKSGAFNLSQCVFGAPMALSLPHFLDADPSYLDNIDGLRPDKYQHASYFFLEPLVSFPMNVSAKFQINAMIERIPHFSFFDQLPSMLFPLAWFEEKGGMTKEIVEQFERQLYQPFTYARIGAYCFVGIGACLGVAALLYFVVARKQRMETHTFNSDANNQNC